MAINSLLKKNGQLQGDIKGSITQKGREGEIMVIAFEHEMQSKFDNASSQIAGRSIHRPFVITKEIDRSSPLLYTALEKMENIIIWELQCFVPRSTGALYSPPPPEVGGAIRKGEMSG